MHRDIKTSNILIKWKNMSDKINCQSYEFCSHHHNPFEMQIKLGDFGFAKNLSSSEEVTASFGTPIYMAPEVISR